MTDPDPAPNESASTPSLIVTLGDPTGIGPEVVAKALARFRGDDARSGGGAAAACDVQLVGSASAFAAAVQQLPDADDRAAVSAVPVTDPGDNDAAHAPGEPGPASGRAALAALGHALREVGTRMEAGDTPALVTAPVAKSALQAAGSRFLDHTTLLGAVSGRDPIMSFVGGGLRVALATVHVPLMTVADCLQPEELARLIVRTGRDFARRERLPGPVRVAVCGLNPHAGEGGLMGHEDDRLIRPAIERACEWLDSGDRGDVDAPGGPESIELTTDGSLPPVPRIVAPRPPVAPPSLEISGPLAGDTVFHRARQGDFDVVIAMYHDQGLIPVKTVAFHDAVNATLNLPFIRTSPDHGTAFDIAPRFVADPGSMTAALHLAHRWLQAQAHHAE